MREVLKKIRWVFVNTGWVIFLYIALATICEYISFGSFAILTHDWLMRMAHVGILFLIIGFIFVLIEIGYIIREKKQLNDH